MVVVPEPAVKGGGAFVARAVDGAVGPAGEQGADEAFGFAVGLWPVGAGAEVADAEPAAGECVQGGAVAGAVVGEHAFDGDAVAAVESDRALQEAGRGRGLLVAEDLRVGEAAVVVARGVDVLPALAAAAGGGAVGIGAGGAAASVPERALAGAAFDSTELLDVDVHELARPRALVPKRLLEPEPAEPPQPEPGQDPRHRRRGHRQRLGDL